MVNNLLRKRFIYSSCIFLLFIFYSILFIIFIQKIILKTKNIELQISNKRTNSTFIHSNKTLETTIQCVGSLYNQSCLYKNLYYVDSAFMILTVKEKHLPPYSVRTNAFILWDTTPNKRVFDTYSDL